MSFLSELHRRMLAGIRLSGDEHATIDAVIKRMRTAIREERGIRLSKDELRILGLYGLKQQVEEVGEVEEDQQREGLI